MKISHIIHLYFFLTIIPLINAQFPQKCYYAPNKLAGSAIIPCGDPRVGVQTCCQNGDYCMSDSVCFNNEMKVTYQYGCTDSSYTDQISCPKKCGLDVEKSNWVGLIYCNGSSNQWDCNHPETCGDYCPTNTIWQQAIQSLPTRPHGCDDLSPQKGAFAGPTSLAPIMLLPTNLGGVTTYFSVSALGGTYITYTATTPFPTNAPASTDNGTLAEIPSTSGLSTSAKAGIGAGIGTAILATAALSAFLLIKRRQRAKPEEIVVREPTGSIFGEPGPVVDENHWSTKAELASDAQTQRFSMPPPQELPTNHSGQDLSLVGRGGGGGDGSGVHELSGRRLAGDL